MAVLALVLYALFGLLAFGLRSLVQVRRTGDSGFRGFSGEPGSIEFWAGVLFAVAIALGVLAPLADLAGWLSPVAALDHPVFRGVGVALAVVGIAGTLVAQLAMGDSWRIGVDSAEQTALVTGGPFELVRNPIFSTMLVTALGLTLMVPNALAIAGLLGLLVGLELHVRLVEEPYLRSVHGTVYGNYAGRVGRFVPGLGRL